MTPLAVAILTAAIAVIGALAGVAFSARKARALAAPGQDPLHTDPDLRAQLRKALMDARYELGPLIVVQTDEGRLSRRRKTQEALLACAKAVGFKMDREPAE